MGRVTCELVTDAAFTAAWPLSVVTAVLGCDAAFTVSSAAAGLAASTTPANANRVAVTHSLPALYSFLCSFMIDLPIDQVIYKVIIRMAINAN